MVSHHNFLGGKRQSTEFCCSVSVGGGRGALSKAPAAQGDDCAGGGRDLTDLTPVCLNKQAGEARQGRLGGWPCLIPIGSRD